MKEFEIFNGVLVKYRGNSDEVTVPDGVKAIAKDAFNGCDVLWSVTVPDSVESIGKGAFFGCDSLEQLMLPKGIVEIGSSAFNGCGRVQICTPDERLAASLSGGGHTVQIINDVNKENTDETC